ncbi:hypothetical protein [Zavarzinia sp.]|uniref:hypothetical protein n=1 Tax=Zavarzinia sp. TaxID=2027920 RepID=UPI003BB6CD14
MPMRKPPDQGKNYLKATDIEAAFAKPTIAHEWAGTKLQVIEREGDTYDLTDDFRIIVDSLTFSAALEFGDLIVSARRLARALGQGNAGRLAVIDTLLQALRPTIGNIPLRLTTEGR